MARTYVELPDLPGIKVPRLHKVVYGARDMLYTSPKEELTIKFRIREWCEQNCKSPFYTSPGWTDDVFVQFEDDEEAMMFALSIPFSH